MSQTTSRLLMPAHTNIGEGAVNELGATVRRFGAKSVFVFTDRGVRDAGLVTPLVEDLGKVVPEVALFDETEQEPTVEGIDKASSALGNVPAAGLLISVGGGSVMDTAKCANIVRMNGGSILDYEGGAEGQRQIARLLPHIAIPTTAGTGSEATVWAVFVDRKRRCKTAVQDPRLVPDSVILDPLMTRTLPPRLTASTGMDALTHAIESYVSVYANPVTEAYCLHAIRLIASSLPSAVADGGDLKARMNMLLASFMAGSAFSNSSLGIVHTMAETLGGFYGIPHGVTNSLMLPHVMEFNWTSVTEKLSTIAQVMGNDTIGLGPDESLKRSAIAASELSERIGLPQKLREVGVDRLDLHELAKMAFKWANISGNPRQITEDQLERLYEEAF